MWGIEMAYVPDSPMYLINLLKQFYTGVTIIFWKKKDRILVIYVIDYVLRLGGLYGAV